MFNEKIKPPLVLTLICIIACGLLVAAYEATYVDTSGVITDKLAEGLTQLYGSADNFEMLAAPDGSGVDSVLTDGKNIAFEVTADGYSSGGLHLLVGMTQSGTVQGVSIIDISDTPGIGTRVQNDSFLSQFKGVSLDSINAGQQTDTVKAKAVWGTHKDIVRLSLDAEIAALTGSSENSFTLDAETGATLSSNGVYKGVQTALAAFEKVDIPEKGADE